MASMGIGPQNRSSAGTADGQMIALQKVVQYNPNRQGCTRGAANARQIAS
jgi:hypothetical protein